MAGEDGWIKMLGEDGRVVGRVWAHNVGYDREMEVVIFRNARNEKVLEIRAEIAPGQDFTDKPVPWRASAEHTE